MNLIKIQPIVETGVFLHSITKKCGAPNKQTRTKPQETLEIEITKPR